MDVVRFIRKALSDDDIKMIVGPMPKSSSTLNWGNFMTSTNCCQITKITALYFTRTCPIEGTGQPYLSTTVHDYFDSHGIKPDSAVKMIDDW